MEIVNLDTPFDSIASIASEPCVMALGFFDGVHKGHQKIIETAKGIAKDKKLTFSVMTFFPHPSTIISKQNKINHYLSPLPVKKEIFARMGVEKLFIVNFNLEFSKVHHQQFVEQYVVGLNCQHVVAGFDFTYGYRGQGNMKQIVLDSHGRFDVTAVSKLEHHHEKISSTAIREMLAAGDVQKIPMYLDNYYSIKGNVIHHDRMNEQGTVLTIKIDESYRLPKEGLYKITVELGNATFTGTMYVPIHNTGTIDIHLFNREIHYDEGNSTIYFIKQKVAERQTEDNRRALVVK